MHNDTISRIIFAKFGFIIVRLRPKFIGGEKLSERGYAVKNRDQHNKSETRDIHNKSNTNTSLLFLMGQLENARLYYQKKIAYFLRVFSIGQAGRYSRIAQGEGILAGHSFRGPA